jgi:hypothetical protein
MAISEWHIFTNDIISIIVGFLHCKDAIKICYLNKSLYAIFLKLVIQHSFVCINTDKINKSSNIINILQTMNLHIDGIKKIREPIFLHIERLAINSNNSWKNLRYISFGRTFNYKIDTLPENIEEIVFHPKSLFNQKITNMNSKKLKKIYFGKSFNQKIDFLPSTIEILHFTETSKFNRPIRNVPHNLIELYFGQWFNQDISAIWAAPNICKLNFATRSIFKHQITPSITLKILSLGIHYCHELDIINSNLIMLKFHKLSRYNHKLSLPATLEILIIGEYYNCELDIKNNNNLHTLHFYARAKFNQPLELPNNCRTLSIGRHFNNKILGTENIKKIIYAKSCKYLRH